MLKLDTSTIQNLVSWGILVVAAVVLWSIVTFVAYLVTP